ncbi:30S ribosomal protein S13 [Candidatus Woesearchaeota archaeon]|nr:30S ribosomal protein S13 [Candidatus Woesearchaeota archaeon]
MAKEDNFRHIVRVANTDLDGNKNVGSALRKIKGVDFSLAHGVCIKAGVDSRKKTGTLSDEEIRKLDSVVRNPGAFSIPDWVLNRRKSYDTGMDEHLVGVDLKLAQEDDVKRLQKIKSYRGMRLAWGLPVRGQRTKSNFRKNKGKVVGVKRRKGVKSGRV